MPANSACSTDPRPWLMGLAVLVLWAFNAPGDVVRAIRRRDTP